MYKKDIFLIFFVVLTSVIISAFHPGQKVYNKFIISDTVDPIVFKAKGHLAKNTISTSGIITFSTGLDNDHYHVDSINRYVYYYVEARLAKLLNAPVKRTPLNLSVVIDRSGSMQGVKMGYAKKSAKSIIDHLEPTDFVSIVMYDNSIDDVQEPVQVIDKEMIKRKIDKITPRGSTNLWGGTERGYEFVKKFYKPGFINRVLLISDGLANAGITDSIQIRNKVQKFKDNDGITLSTFGIGLDYNETLMTDMAETGAGNYYFIDAPEKMISIANKELNGMLNIIAKGAELQLKLPNGVKIDNSYPLRITQNGDVVIIKFLDLFAEETKSNLIRFRLDNNVKGPLKFTATLSYTDVMDDKLKVVTNQNSLLPVKKIDTYLTHFNKSVIEQTVLFTANENMEKAMSRADAGDYNGAASIIRDNSTYMKKHTFYVSQSAELMRMDSTNTHYFTSLAKASKMNIDSVKKMQKSNKAESYQVRNKKQ